MQDSYEALRVLGYVKSILSNRRMAYANINHLANFIDSITPVLSLPSKYNKAFKFIEETAGCKVDKFHSKDRMGAIIDAISKIIEAYRSQNNAVNNGGFNSRIVELTSVLGLGKEETDFFEFLIRYQCHDHFNQLINDISSNSFSVKEICTVCLKITKDNLTRLLTSYGLLLTSGAIEYEGLGGKYLSECFSVPELIIAAMQRADTSGEDVLQLIIGQPEQATLDWQDFDHVSNSRDRLLPFLKSSVTQRLPGINILLYGPPGTGKTEFCKTIANKMETDLYSLSEHSNCGNEPSRSDRLSGYRLAQNLLKKKGDCILLFDEMDDLFSSHFVLSLFSFRTSNISKVFLKRL